MSTSVVLIVVIAGLAGTLIPALVIGVLVYVFTAGSRARLPVAPDGSLTLQGHLRRPDQVYSISANWGSDTYGTASVVAGTFYWQGDDGSRWSVPLTSVAVHSAHGGFALTGPGVALQIEGSGAWYLTISDRQINRFSRNTAKTQREGALARLFGSYLVTHGAVDCRR